MFLQVCPVCEHRNPRGSRFCNECGSPLQLRFCPACHAAEDVMALECRSCGEPLPLVAVADAADPMVTVGAAAESIWRPQAPQPSPLHLPDDEPVTVHGGATPAPALDLPPPKAPPDPESEPAWRTEPVVARLNLTGRTLIERLQSTQPEIALHTRPPVSAATAEPATAAPELTPESESEIEVSAEAETLVEASFAPFMAEAPEAVIAAEPVAIEDLGPRLRAGAWQSALATDASPVTTLAPAVIHVAVPTARRLSVNRVGLMVVAIGVLATTVYAIRLSPDDGPAPAQAAAQVPAPAPAAPPARNAAGALPPAAGLAVAAPAAVSAQHEPAPQTPAAAPEPSHETPVVTEQPAAARPAVRRAPAAVAAPAETFAPVAAQARRAPAAPPQPCTEAIAALGLCTLEPRKEEN